MAGEWTKTGSKAALLFGLFVGLGFLISAGIGLMLTNYAIEGAMKALHVSNVASKAEGLRAVAERALAAETEATRRLAASPMVRYRVTKELRRSPELLHAMIFDADGRAVYIGAETTDAMQAAMRRLAASRAAEAAPNRVAVELSPDRRQLILVAPVRSAVGLIGAFARIAPAPAAGRIGAGEALILALGVDAPRTSEGAGRLIADTPLSTPGLTLRYYEPMDAMRPQARWVEQVVSLAIVAGLVIAFTLILAIGRRLILRPQVELALSRARLRQSEEEARRLALVAEKATDFIMITDADGTLTWVNPALEAGTGWSREEVVGRKARDLFFGDETTEEVRETLRRARALGVGAEVRSINRRKTGERYIADIKLTPVRDKGGAVTSYVVIERDVTETAAAEERLRRAVDLMDDAFAMVDAEGRFRVVNRAYRDWMASRGVTAETGVSYRDFLLEFALRSGHDLGGLSPEAWRDRFFEEAHSETGREFYLTEESGRTTWRRYRRLPGGEIVILATDVTELTRARARAEAAVEAKARFSASISHELRTPLIGVISMAELLQESDLSDSQRSGVELIAASGSALLAIINDILDFSKLDAGKLTLREEAFDPVELIEDVCALLTSAAEAKGVRLLFRFDPAAARRLVGDAGRIRQIVTNLVGNAVKFTSEGHVHVTFEAPVEGDRARFRLSVEDTGPGVPKADLERIFAPYEQVEGPRVAASSDGTGLGLAICRQLAALMDGRIDATSEPGTGSVFRFRADLAVGRDETSPALDGLAVELAAAEPWRGATEDQLTRLGATVLAPGAAGPDAPRVVVLAQGGALPHGATQGKRHGPSVVIAPPGGDGAPEAHGDLVLALGAGPCRILHRPIRSALLARTLAAVGEAPERTEAARGEGGGAPQVMLVEDNETTAMIVQAMLRGRGLALRRFVEAGPAVAAQAEAPAAVILMDMNLPDMTGPEAVRLIRAAEAASGAAPAAILAFTASTEEADHAACLEAGMDGVVTKPVAKDALLAAILERLPEAPPRAAAG